MRKQLAFTVALLVGAAACGGNGTPDNAAVGKTFAYGSPGSASSDQSSALEAQLATVQGSPDPSNALVFSDFTNVTEALLGEYLETSIGLVVAPGSQQALTMRGNDTFRRFATVLDPGSFDNAGCITVTATSAVLKGCRVTVSETQSGGTITVTADGSATYSDASHTLVFSLTVGLAASDPPTGNTIDARFVRSGSITDQSSTVNGNVLSTLDAHWTVSGKSSASNVSEAVLLDNVTYQTSPRCITGGTLEAKRVWTTRPSGYDATSLPDRGAKVTWQGCGIVQVALSK